MVGLGVEERHVSVGGQVKFLRQSSALSLSSLSRVSGVAKSTLSRWESGVSEPDVPTLELVLEALGATNEQRAKAFASLSAPRGHRALRELDRAEGSFLEELGIRAPGFGSLIRALRKRAGHSRQSFSQLLGVSVGCVSQWELSERVPSQEKLATIAELLTVSTLERQWLFEKRLPARDPEDTQTTLEEWLRRLVDQTAIDRRMDEFEALCFEAEAWRVAQFDPAGAAALGQYYNVRAGLSCDEFEVEDIRLYARKASDLPYLEGPLVVSHLPDSCLAWAEYGSRGLERIDRYLAGLERCLDKRLDWYQRWSLRLYLAKFYAEQGRVAQMVATLEAAEADTVGQPDDGLSDMFQTYVAECWEAAGYPERAMTLLPQWQRDVWGVPAQVQTTKAKALVAMRELSSAKECLDAVAEWVVRHGQLSVEVRQAFELYCRAAGVSRVEAFAF